MANISLVQPLGLVRQLELLIRGHLFQISTIVLKLNAPGAYPLLLGDHDSKLLASNKIGRKMSLLFAEVKQRYEYQHKKQSSQRRK